MAITTDRHRSPSICATSAPIVGCHHLGDRRIVIPRRAGTKGGMADRLSRYTACRRSRPLASAAASSCAVNTKSVNVNQRTCLGCLMVAVTAAGTVPKAEFTGITVDSRIGELLNHPAFAGFADRILPRADLEVDRDAKLGTIAPRCFCITSTSILQRWCGDSTGSSTMRVRGDRSSSTFAPRLRSNASRRKRRLACSSCVASPVSGPSG